MMTVLRNQNGSGAIELVLAAAFILFPFAVLLLSFPVQMEYRSMADAAARQAARACAVAYGPAEGQNHAEAIAQIVLSERGLDSSSAVVAVDCLSSWAPGSVVTATVSVEAPAFSIMEVWTVGSLTMTSTYREQIEPYRSLPR
ncbi:MAG: hypothetical protein OXH10_06405 [bacterium]|nr:hypothetical protein [bacterium]